MALCPNCSAALAVTAEACANCKAEFGANATWRPLPQSAAEQEELAKLQNARPKEPPARPAARGPLALLLVIELSGLAPWFLVTMLTMGALEYGAKGLLAWGPIWLYPLFILICAPRAFQLNAGGRTSTASRVMLAPVMIVGGWFGLILVISFFV